MACQVQTLDPDRGGSDLFVGRSAARGLRCLIRKIHRKTVPHVLSTRLDPCDATQCHPGGGHHRSRDPYAAIAGEPYHELGKING